MKTSCPTGIDANPQHGDGQTCARAIQRDRPGIFTRSTQPGLDLQQAAAVADRALKIFDTKGGRGVFASGVVEYRAGHYEAAIDRLIRSRGTSIASNVAPELFLAMSYHRAGKIRSNANL